MLAITAGRAAAPLVLVLRSSREANCCWQTRTGPSRSSGSWQHVLGHSRSAILGDILPARVPPELLDGLNDSMAEAHVL
jgi:hypothetical protein